MTFVVKRIDDRLVKTSLPGQYVTVRMRMPDGVRQPRQYSLTRADDGEHRQFAVKRVHGGGLPEGEVSTLLHDAVERGDILTMSVPYGEVVLDDAGRPPCSPVPAWASPRWPECSPTSSRPEASLDHPAACRRPRGHLRPAPPGRQRHPRAAQRFHPRLVRGGRTDPRTGQRMPHRDDGSLRGRPTRQRHLLPVRSLAVHAGRAHRTDRAPGVTRDIQYEVFGPDLWQADFD